LNLPVLCKIGLITAVAVSLYQLSDLLLVYHYFRYEYYITGVAIIALATGIILTKRHYQHTMVTNSDHPIDNLTVKELQVLKLVYDGKSNKEIAVINYIELSTVKTHINNIYFKLGMKNRKEAAKTYQNYYFGSKSTLSPPSINLFLTYRLALWRHE